MKNIIVIILLSSLIFLYNCKKDPKGASVEKTIAIEYINMMGDDLFNPNTLNCYYPDDIRIYNVIGGVKKLAGQPNYTNPNNFLISKYKLNSHLLIVSIETDTTLIELNPNTVDTVIGIIDKSHGNQTLRKVWYNGDLQWEDIGSVHIITIIK